MSSDVEIRRLWCDAGHFWDKTVEAAYVNKKPPRCCPDHFRFFQNTVPDNKMPPARIIAEWQYTADDLLDYDYVERWTARWKDLVRRLGGQANAWHGVDIDLLEMYVQALRLVELHEIHASRVPYVTSSGGAVKPHPGWALREIEVGRVRDFQSRLKLKFDPDSSNVYEPTDRESSSKGRQYTTALQEAAEDHEEVKAFVDSSGVPL